MGTSAKAARPRRSVTGFQWLRTGDEAFVAMLDAIDGARQTVRFETYIFERGEPGDRFRAALIRAVQRDVQVYALVDAWGSMELPVDYWTPLINAGGEFRWFNKQRFLKGTFRNHRKLLVVDDRIAYVGGYNIASDHLGDGINWGWRDIGILLNGPLAAGLSETFDRMFMRAELKHRSFLRVMKTGAHKRIDLPDGQIILSGPGRGFSRLKKSLKADLRKADRVQIMAAYFLPTYRLRVFLAKLARQGVKVQLLLPGKSDVALSQWASRRLYNTLLKNDIEIYEYQPQVLHGKLIIIDDAVYVGSANLDTRSLHINYELSLRLEDPAMADAAREVFADALKNARRIHLKPWRKSRDILDRWKEKLAYWLLARFDLYLARKQLIDLR
jgi:cardiolipin synthase A/B